MTIHSSILRCAAVVGCITALVLPARAEYLPASDRNAARSVQSALGVSSVAVLRRTPRSSPERELAVLIAAVGLRAGNISKERVDGRIHATTAAWQLDVFGDGSAAEFTNLGVQRLKHKTGVPVSRALPVARLEAAARDYIAHNLSQVVVLHDGERLVAVVRSLQTDAGFRANGTRFAERVVANRIVFTREIDGIPVVGAGSKVTVTFTNSGSVESFRYDWPVYTRTGATQAVLSPPEILRRVQRVTAIRTNESRPIPLGGSAQLERFECGYYDPGITSRDPRAVVQSGCYYHVLHHQGTGEFVTFAGYSGAVPAARQPIADARWPENQLLRGYVRPVKPPSVAAPSTYVRPVPTRPPPKLR